MSNSIKCQEQDHGTAWRVCTCLAFEGLECHNSVALFLGYIVPAVFSRMRPSASCTWDAAVHSSPILIGSK